MKETAPYLPGSVWTFADAAALFIGGVIGSLIAITVAVAINGGTELDTVPLLVVSSLGQAAVTLGLLAYMSRSRGTGTWDLDFGFRFEASDWRGLLYGMGLQIGVTLLVLVPLAALLGLDDPPQQDVADIAGDASSLGGRIAVLVVLVVVAPVTEELLFRGVLLSRLTRAMSPTYAVIVSALLFAGIHLIDPDAAFVAIGLFVIGLVVGWQALRTGRLGLSIMTHAGVNLLAAIALLLDLDV